MKVPLWIGRVALFAITTSLLLIIAFAYWKRDRPPLVWKIKATASRLNGWEFDNTIPSLYEQELIELAKEPTDELHKAFESLDKERSIRAGGGRPQNDAIWLTGTLITILAFDCPPVTERDGRLIYQLKSKLSLPQDLERTPANDKLLAEWPWSKESGSWHLETIYFNNWGTSDGAIAPRFEYYASRFERRQLPYRALLDELSSDTQIICPKTPIASLLNLEGVNSNSQGWNPDRFLYFTTLKGLNHSVELLGHQVTSLEISR